MNEDRNHNSVKRFFKYMVGGFLISSIRVSLTGMNTMQIINDIFITFWYNVIVGIGTGIAAMVGIDMYLELKKNGINNYISNLKLCF